MRKILGALLLSVGSAFAAAPPPGVYHIPIARNSEYPSGGSITLVIPPAKNSGPTNSLPGTSSTPSPVTPSPVGAAPAPDPSSPSPTTPVPVTAPTSFSDPAPAQAQKAGFTNLVFSDDFSDSSSFTPSVTAQGGCKWYPYTWGTATAAQVVYNSGGGVALSGTIQTVPTRPQTGATPIPGTFQHAYFEAKCQFSPTAGGNRRSWPSFWSYGISTFGYMPTGYTAELDFFEAYPIGTGFDPINTIHNWAHSSSGTADTYNTNGTNQMISLQGSTESAVPNDGAWHTYGCLWVKTTADTGYVEYYYDNSLVVHQNGVTRYATGAGTPLNALENDNMYVILGGAPGWPMNVEWVKVWQ